MRYDCGSGRGSCAWPRGVMRTPVPVLLALAVAVCGDSDTPEPSARSNPPEAQQPLASDPATEPGEEAPSREADSIPGLLRRLALTVRDGREWLEGAIRSGGDLSRVGDEWLYWLLAGDDSPIEPWRDNPRISEVAGLYGRRLAGNEPARHEWESAKDAACQEREDIANAEITGELRVPIYTPYLFSVACEAYPREPFPPDAAPGYASFAAINAAEVLGFAEAGMDADKYDPEKHYAALAVMADKLAELLAAPEERHSLRERARESTEEARAGSGREADKVRKDAMATLQTQTGEEVCTPEAMIRAGETADWSGGASKLEYVGEWEREEWIEATHMVAPQDGRRPERWVVQVNPLLWTSLLGRLDDKRDVVGTLGVWANCIVAKRDWLIGYPEAAATALPVELFAMPTYQDGEWRVRKLASIDRTGRVRLEGVDEPGDGAAATRGQDPQGLGLPGASVEAAEAKAAPGLEVDRLH